MQATSLLRKLIELAGGPAERGYILALDGETLGSVPPQIVTERASYSVHRPKTELALRRLLWKSNGAPFIALVNEPLARALPVDLVRRARGARILALELNDILELVLGVRVVLPEDREVQELVLSHLERLHAELRKRTLPTVVDRALLDELLLEVAVQQRVRDANPHYLLAEWIKQTLPLTRPIQSLLERTLPMLQGTEGRILAWGLKHQRLRELVVRGALLAIDVDDLPPAIWGQQLEDLRHGKDIGLADEALRRILVSMAIGALDALGETAAGLLADAEREARQLLQPKVLAQSTVLPLGLENRCTQLAAQAALGQPIPMQELEWLRHHRAARFKEADLGVLEELARLSRYLAEPLALATDTLDGVTRFQRQGAFADLAASRLKRALAATASFHSESATVLQRWRTRRDDENLHFARLLADHYERGLFHPGILPLQRLWKQEVLPILDRSEARCGVLVVVLDGCSYSVFLELLDALAHLPDRPIGLKLAPEMRDAQGFPALAPLPTVTSHARGALFLGELPKDPLIAETVWREQAEGATDPARFNRNPALGGRSRRLFLKGDLTDGGQALRQTLQDPGIDVVAVVFNAIDDQIGSSNTGMALQVKPEHIAGFLPALRGALDAGRRVLVTADHGHTPFVGSALRMGKGAAPRYKILERDEAAPAGFLEIDLKGLGGTEGRVAFAWKLGAYLGQPQVGFHGGCGLEEMVVPLAWLTYEGVPADEPAWWYGHAAELHTSMPEPVSPSRESTRQEKSTPPKTNGNHSNTAAMAASAPAQFDLFNARAFAQTLALQIGRLRLPDVAVALLDEDQRAALVFLAEVKSARATELGNAIRRTAPRVPGFMTQLRRRLHEVGLECFRIEPLPSGENQFIWIFQNAEERR